MFDRGGVGSAVASGSGASWRGFLAALVCTCIVVLLPHAVLGGTEPSTNFDFARAMYGPWEVDELGNFSWDVKYRNSWWHHSGAERVLARFAEESLRAAASNVTYIAGLYYHAAPWDRLPFSYTHAVHYSGVVESYTPSPLDQTWWENTMHEPAVAVANLSLHYPIWGLVWDIELYGHSAMLRTDYSYDLPTVRWFAETFNLTVPELKIHRGYNWLKDQGLLPQYHRWMEERMYDMAKRTEEEVHAINPFFNLGLLGTEDSWHHWAILKAFNSSTASVTSWGEYTYGGWGDPRTELHQKKFEELGLNGKYVPGIRPPASLGKFFWDFGMAIRNGGLFWVYQHNGDPWTWRDPEWYVKMYQLFDQYVFFNGTDAYPLPELDLMPTAGGHPYLGPEGQVALFIFTRIQDKPFDKELLPLGFQIISESQGLTYIGENLSRRTLPGPNPYLEPEDLPCIVSGLREEDLLPTEAWSLFREAEFLYEIFESAGIEKPGYLFEMLDLAESDLEAGRYAEAITRLAERRGDIYLDAIEATRPLVEKGFENPRESEIPLEILRKFYLADGKLQRGELWEGELLVIKGMQDIAMVMETPVLAGLMLLALLVTLGSSTDQDLSEGNDSARA